LFQEYRGRGEDERRQPLRLAHETFGGSRCGVQACNPEGTSAETVHAELTAAAAAAAQNRFVADWPMAPVAFAIGGVAAAARMR